jgi:hypothetical protein
MVSVASTGLVNEAIRKIVSRLIGAEPSKSYPPMQSTWTSSPQASSVTSPGICFAATLALIASCSRCRSAAEIVLLM